MKEIRILLCCALMCCISGFFAYRISNKEQKKIVVIDAVKLFDGYNMKKELEQSDKVKLQSTGRHLDSIGNILQKAKALNVNKDELDKLSYQYANVKNKLDEDYAKSNHDINEQVWGRLNPLLAEYGKKNDLHVIIGANGMGSVLYTDDYSDITDEAIKYVNKRYAEGN